MKHINRAFAPLTAIPALLLIAGLALAPYGCAESTTAATEAEENLMTLHFAIDGMHCEGCSSSVRNAIAGIDGVSSCEVSLAGKSATVKAADGAVASRIMQAVRDLDFTIEQTGDDPDESGDESAG